ncbi:uncharacterized protein LOC121669688 [Corvus kubaryi]|uniref:uncharacterized protein LOC116450477 n=1 Tax=Corvus moneduloides TaxID=1196302 RepID=UPI001363562E|nr:uncharacterized protein LOC116450477 [Corvus moneduloides]XP_041894911.1 uncharacterized protein LOC121669688 [Corvus kubaryi]
MGWERLGVGRPPQAGLRERERLPGRRHHGNALPPGVGGALRIAPSSQLFHGSARSWGSTEGREGPRKQRRSLRHGGRAVRTERGPCLRLPRQQTPASRQKVRW